MRFEDLVTKKDLELLEERIINAIQISGSKNDRGFGWVRTDKASKILGLSKSNLANLRARGEITFSKLGNLIYYDLDDIDRQLRRQCIDSIHKEGNRA